MLVPATAAAQRRHDGFVGQLQLGIGWCTDRACDENNLIDAEIGKGLSVGAFVGYRFPTPYLSLGANLQYSMHPIDDEDEAANDASAHSFAFDFGARGHPVVEGPLDPWVGLGFGYAFLSSSWTNELADDREESQSLSGPAFVFSFGADGWVNDDFAVGAAVRYMLVFASEVCLDTEGLDLAFDGDTCVSPSEWEDRDNAFFDFDEDDLPDLVQILLTGTFSPG
jgi:hypothetical protein